MAQRGQILRTLINAESGAGNRNASVAPQVLPDFCSDETVLRVLIMAVLLALLGVLARGGGFDPMALAPVVFFIAWVALSSLVILCVMQRWLRWRRPPLQIALSAATPVINTALVHWTAEQFLLMDSEGRLRAIMISVLLSLIAMYYLHLVAAWRQEARAVFHAREQAMRARVKPHFLFNSMNTIAGLCRSDPAKAEQVTLDLADLFRATFATEATHSLAYELELGHAYLAIEQTRFGDRLQLDWDTGEVERIDLKVPALFLQPLVENAIQHGIAPNRAGGWVKVRGRRLDNVVLIEVSNSVGDQTGRGTQTASRDVRTRLSHHFGAQARLEIQLEPDLFRACVSLPLNDPGPRVAS
jgi:two-component system, LytTR family, sensor histidine kinase AlgZ